jgi:hypothetical protein
MSSRPWAIIGHVGSTFVRLLGWRVGFGLGVLMLWELAAGRWIDPFWFSSPLRWRPRERTTAARELQ